MSSMFEYLEFQQEYHDSDHKTHISGFKKGLWKCGEDDAIVTLVQY